jgi:DNA polymerase-3 subunit epsilon
LGKLVRALGIPMRHRASGDALATVKLFKMLLDKDLEKLLSQILIKAAVQKELSNLLEESERVIKTVGKIKNICGKARILKDDVLE